MSDTVQRPEGFYWIKFREQWIIAEWFAAAWWLTRAPGRNYASHDFVEIGERIELPTCAPRSE